MLLLSDQALVRGSTQNPARRQLSSSQCARRPRFAPGRLVGGTFHFPSCFSPCSAPPASACSLPTLCLCDGLCVSHTCSALGIAETDGRARLGIL